MREQTIRRLNLLAEKVRPWNEKPNLMPKELRDEFCMMFSSTFSDFKEFCELGMKFLGFDLTEMQGWIAEYMQHGPKKRMVQAQRGEAKTTIAALYCVWCLIQDPTYRILVVSSGEDMSNDIAVLIIRLIEQWYLLCWLRPDTSKGDRNSYEHYDVHYSLRRVEKTASVSCVGIKANLPGKRADLILADDVESISNSNTQVMRDDLMNRTKEFTAICTHGHILYLGTPQSRESIYKSLLSRGFSIRIYPGRYPEPDRLERYLPGTLAPEIIEALEADPSLGTGGGLDGSRGKVTDPGRYTEEDLQDKELDYGPEGFDLQYMLDTTLTDEARTKIKIPDLVVYAGSYEEAPETLSYSAEPRLLLKDSDVLTEPFKGYRVYSCAHASSTFGKYEYKIMEIDPAGNGGDEVAYACGGVFNSYVHLFSVGGLQGGMSKQNINTLIDLCVEFGITKIWVESNMGAGTVEQLIIAELESRKIHDIAVEGYYNGTQKEKRIIDTVSPLTRRHKLIVHERAIQDDWMYCKKYTPEKRMICSAFYQLANITYDRNSLAKDDRADAVAGMVRHLVGMIAVDDEKLQEKRDEAEKLAFIMNPMGYKDYQRKDQWKSNRVKRSGHSRLRSR